MNRWLALILVFLGGAASLYAYYYVRRREQDVLDASHITYELGFPRDLPLDQASRVFTALGGLYVPPPPTRRHHARPTLVFEVLGLSDGLHHLLSFPKGWEDSVRGHLRSVMPAIGIKEVAYYPRDWSVAVELKRPAGARIEVEPKLIAVLLSSMRDITDKEAVLIQFVTTPTGHVLQLDKDDIEIAAPFWAVGRLAADAEKPKRASNLLKQTLAAYRSLGVFYARDLKGKDLKAVKRWQAPIVAWPIKATEQLLAVVCGFPIDGPQVPGLVLGRGRRRAPEPAIASVGRVIGAGNFIGLERPIAMTTEDRLRHTYIVSPTGGGKSALLHNLIAADIDEGFGVAVIDPKGDLIHDVLDTLPQERLKDVVLYDALDEEHPIGFNIFQGEDPYAITSQLVSLFDAMFDLSHTAPRAINVLRYAILTAAMGKFTLLEVNTLLRPDQEGVNVRGRVVPGIDNPELSLFWEKYADKSRSRELLELGAPIEHRLSQLLLYPTVRHSLGQATSGFNMNQVLNENKILLVPLNRGLLGDELAEIIASLVLTKLWQATQARPVDKRRPFFTYVDEFQDVVNLPATFNAIFAQARGYQMGMTVAHQHLGQLGTELRKDLLANARTKLVFATAADDARTLANELGPLVSEHDIQALERFEIIAQIAVSDRIAEPVTVITSPPPVSRGTRAAAIAASRATYARNRQSVEAEIQARRGRLGLNDAAMPSPMVKAPAVPKPREVIGWEDIEDDE